MKPFFHRKSADADIDSLTRAFSLTTTTSSLSSTSSSTGGSTGGASNKSGLSALSHSLLPHKHHPRPSALTPSFSLPTSPLALCELAISLAISYPGPSIEELREEILPKLYHVLYVHRVNCRETDLEGLLDVVEILRGKFRKIHVRFRSNLMDNDGTATMQQAAVGLTYDVVGTPKGPKHEVEDKRTSVMAIFKIADARIAQADFCIDTLPFQENSGGTELSCCVM